MNAYEMAKKYYPKLWSLGRLNRLLAANMLTQGEYEALTAQDKTAEEGSVAEEADHVY